MAIHELDNFRYRKLRQHRREEMDMDHNILITTISGPIDYATVNAVAQVRTRSFEELDGTKVASIIIFQRNMKVTPEALELFSQVIKDQKIQSDKQLFVAYVVEPGIEDSVATCAKFQAIFAQNGIDWQAFEKLEDAQMWARSMVGPDPAELANRTG